MSTAVLGKTEVGVRRTTTDIKVDETPKSKLMYYFNCICTVLQMENTPRISRLRNYRKHRVLSEEDTDHLLLLCFFMSPDELVNKCIFMDESMCHEYLNEFYEISAVSRAFVVSPEVLVGGERKQVRKIMCFTQSWLKDNYIDPMKTYEERLRRITSELRSAASRGTSASPRRRPQPSAPPSSQDSSCVIL
ncbi:uncharacterized protein LOC106178719 [Lingula anatina]|uniref:Uncharacterized protein LOC106178719 n=1 Tax=Lingula anatina TaxID=7574 RepID=A0A1S3K4B5_LINAN|nr:uncharacterized protein LOC106178719 [Lingula anatina]|eukprot:XP_013417470.1 uncharacterized protein LOC106178719 [Lingula anatina]